MKHDLSVFHRVWIFLLLALLVGCASCSMGSKKSGNEELVETAGEAGCHIKSIKLKEGQIEQIDCHDTVRYVR